MASYESIKAIAAVLEIPLAQLSSASSVNLSAPRFRRSLLRLSVAIAFVVAACGAFATGMLAKDVMLNVGLEHNGERISKLQLLTSEGKDAEVCIEGIMRFVISPEIQSDGNVLLTAKLYESKGDKFVLLSAPTVVTRNVQQAEGRFTSPAGESFRVTITPRHALAAVKSS